MTSPPVAERALTRPATAQVWRLFILPLTIGALAMVIAGLLGYLWGGFLFTVGLCLGACNGFAAQVAAVRMAGTDGVDRSAIVRSSLRRLGLVTLVAIAIAFLTRPTGWVVLLGVAGYQMIATAATVGATMKELRNG